MSYSIYQLLQLFLIYAFLGWCVEVCFVAVTTGKVVNRGFLNGPVCPIYGVGMLGALLLLEPISGNLLLLFLLGMLLCTLVELVGGWILERAFHTRWWDYSDKPLNLGGFVCLGFSIMWGFAVTFAVRLIHPLILTGVNWLPQIPGWILIGIFYALFLTDFVLTLITVIGLRKRLGELEKVGEALHAVGDAISDRVGNSALAADAKLDEVVQTGQERVAEGKERLADAKTAGQRKLVEAKEAGQEKMAEGKEKLVDAKTAGQRKIAEAKEAGQRRYTESVERLELRISGTLQELQDRRTQLEHRQKELMKSLTGGSRFGTRRLTGAFPALRMELKERMERLRSDDRQE